MKKPYKIYLLKNWAFGYKRGLRILMMPLDSALYHNNVFRDLKVNNIDMSRYNFTLITLRNIKFKISFATQLEVW